jgi:regulatory protein
MAEPPRPSEDAEPPRLTEDASERALELAYRHLNRRARTEAEVRSHLQARGVDSDAIEPTVASLREQGYLDDERFSRLFTQDKRDLEQWGSERIRRTLLARGIDRDLVEAALRQAPNDELTRARELLRRRFRSPLLDRRERERALGVLLRKGFDSDLALDALAGHEPDPLP